MSKLLKQFDKNNCMYVESNNKKSRLEFYMPLKNFSFSSNLFLLHCAKLLVSTKLERNKTLVKDHR